MYHFFSWRTYQTIILKVARSMIGQDQLMVNRTFSLLDGTKAEEVLRCHQETRAHYQ
jgi:hypothetical protein